MTIDFLLNGYILEKLTYYEWEDCTSNITAVFYRVCIYWRPTSSFSTHLLILDTLQKEIQ